MIPVFPKFKKIEITDKEEIEEITNKFSPYSDFNFISMWSWDVEGEIKISKLNGNIVVHFSDYIFGGGFYSFLGNNKVNETTELLLQLSKEEKLKDCLKLMPEDSVIHLDKERFNIREDEDNFDYIYSIEKLKNYSGNKLRGRRNFCHRFNKNYSTITKVLETPDEKFKIDALNLFKLWVKNRGLSLEEVNNEQKAIGRCFQLRNYKNTIFVGLFLDKELIAFSICEIINKEYALLHFEKADEQYIGIYSYIMQENARILSNYGVKYINLEQDLGLPGLKLSKKSFQPIFFLKKYIVCWK